ncbi:hypothetical protein P691DRAFT_792005 [Macrolepiota fuliginosa MF-IS2]|uniref:Uncharacterized protein n=1 Tax=Macrolepiota fuliginosa MF-IS2 TaxID=1400762 RepID=A0A9P5WY16_9AGAR|nr:hypothetical protein P691DRAFT_792005 [Macrolepiota fuliginosa MF-IS2]
MFYVQTLQPDPGSAGAYVLKRRHRVAAHSTSLFAPGAVPMPLVYLPTSPTGIGSDDGQVYIGANVAVAAGGGADAKRKGTPSNFINTQRAHLARLSFKVSYAEKIRAFPDRCSTGAAPGQPRVGDCSVKIHSVVDLMTYEQVCLVP